MTVIKNQKSNTYEVRTYYKDWTGVRKQKTKRGFKRKCDAQEWERAFKLKENLSLDMYFEDFVDLYLNDIKSRIKYNTWLTKKHIVEKKILPYFSKKKLQEIKPSDIRQWQNTMMNYRNKQGEGYSQVYLKTIAERSQVSRGIIEVLYLLRCSLMHGEVFPDNNAMEVYKYAYSILAAILKKMF